MVSDNLSLTIGRPAICCDVNTKLWKGQLYAHRNMVKKITRFQRIAVKNSFQCAQAEQVNKMSATTLIYFVSSHLMLSSCSQLKNNLKNNYWSE